MPEWMVYYSRWLKRLFQWIWFYVAIISGLFALAIRYLQEHHPSRVSTVNHWAWFIPLWLFLVLGGVRVFIVPYILHKEDKARADEAIKELEAKIIAKPDIRSLFLYEKGEAIIEVTNSGPVADVWAPMRVEGMMRKKPGDAFAWWTHTDLVKTRIAKGQTCRLRIAHFEVNYQNNALAQWIVYSTSEAGAGEDRPMYSVPLGVPEVQSPDIHIYVNVVSDPDNASGIKKHHIVLHSREAEEII
jgi:hypothetical protein